MNREEIKEILPHRGSMLLLDELEKKEDEAIGRLHISGNEWFLDGHFPGNPIVPGVILCEIMAQSACILLENNTDERKIPFYTGLDNVKFRSPVRAGDDFVTHCRITRSKGNFYFAKGRGYVGDRICVQAEFSFALT